MPDLIFMHAIPVSQRDLQTKPMFADQWERVLKFRESSHIQSVWRFAHGNQNVLLLYMVAEGIRNYADGCTALHPDVPTYDHR